MGIGTNDYVLLAINSVQMWLAGIIFSLSFSLASDKFRSKPARTRASTIMNVVYYVAMPLVWVFPLLCTKFHSSSHIITLCKGTEQVCFPVLVQIALETIQWCLSRVDEPTHYIFHSWSRLAHVHVLRVAISCYKAHCN